MDRNEIAQFFDKYGVSLDMYMDATHYVDAEVVAALIQHGKPTSDPCRGTTNLTEEVGEVAAAAAEATRGGALNLQHLRHMCVELAQVAAYATLLMISMRVLERKVLEDNSDGA